MDYSAEFPIVGRLAFFNHAGVAPISGRAAAALRGYAEQAETAAYFRAGWQKRIVQVKKAAARLIGAESGAEIAFVANTSTGIAMVANGLDWREGDEVVITDVEYPANRYPWENLKRLGVRLIEVAQRADGRVLAEDVCDAVTDRTRVVSVSHVQYASGYRTDLRAISEMVHRAGGYLCVDGIQSVGVMPVDVGELGVDFLAADGHKWMLGPEGCGIFYARGDLAEVLRPAVVGWMNMVDSSDYGNYRFEFHKDARRFEPGSYNIPGILALGASLDLLLEVGMEQVWARVEALTGRLCAGLAGKGYRVFSPRGDGERSGIVVFEAGGDGAGVALPRVIAGLEAKGVVIVQREGRLRASPHFYNTFEQVDGLVDGLG